MFPNHSYFGGKFKVESLCTPIYNKRRKKLKTLKDLTLLSKFLFDETMDMPQAHEAALRIIFGDQRLRLLSPAQTEKEIRTMPWLRSIRLDVFAIDEDLTVYDTEMQNEYRSDLAKRSRYYQGLIDSSLLEPGSADFNRLNAAYVIMITPFDLFGQGKYCYTFRPYCEEDRNILLNDGAVRIFLNTRGTNESEVSRELVDFLHYIEHTDEQSAMASGSENIRRIHECVKQIKSSEEMGVKYMQAWEEKLIERQKGMAEGESKGRLEGRMDALLSWMEVVGEPTEHLKALIHGQKDAEVLSQWLKLAYESKSLEEFEKKISNDEALL